MHKDGFYSSGEFAKKANVSVRTIRYYDKENILKPTFVTEDGARFYTDSDFTRLQQVLLLKYLGFSLNDIRDMTIGDSDYQILKSSLQLQKKLIQDKIAQMQMVAKAIDDTAGSIEETNSVDWNNLLNLIHLTTMENSMKMQYLNAGNISARINLHTLFSVNKNGWFNWIFEQAFGDLYANAVSSKSSVLKILELGAGDGALWTDNVGNLALLGRKQKIEIDVSDISDGMIRDAKRNIKEATKTWKDRDINVAFKFITCPCEKIKAKNETYDFVIANHVLFYSDNITESLKEIKRVLKPSGKLVCSTYGKNHMKEIGELVNSFDKRIVLESDKLFEKFGLENGKEIMSDFFKDITRIDYDDCLIVNQVEPLVEYILSCHGNQNRYLLDRYGEFKTYIAKKIQKTIKITKEAGIFIAKQERV